MDKYYEQTRREMLEFMSVIDVRCVLDVGCGQGVFAALVKDSLGAEVWGVELVEAQGRVAEKSIDKVLIGGFDDVYDQLPNSHFDCIVFNDVLEHIIDPSGVLDRAKSLLRPGGVVVCSIPNVRYFPNLIGLLVKKDWRYRESGILDRTHLRFFTKKSIRRMFVECGYKEKLIAGINPLKSKKYLLFFWIVNFVTVGWFMDSRYQQYACVMLASDDQR